MMVSTSKATEAVMSDSQHCTGVPYMYVILRQKNSVSEYLIDSRMIVLISPINKFIEKFVETL